MSACSRPRDGCVLLTGRSGVPSCWNRVCLLLWCGRSQECSPLVRIAWPPPFPHSGSRHVFLLCSGGCLTIACGLLAHRALRTPTYTPTHFGFRKFSSGSRTEAFLRCRPSVTHAPLVRCVDSRFHLLPWCTVRGVGVFVPSQGVFLKHLQNGLLVQTPLDICRKQSAVPNSVLFAF